MMTLTLKAGRDDESTSSNRDIDGEDPGDERDSSNHKIEAQPRSLERREREKSVEEHLSTMPESREQSFANDKKSNEASSIISTHSSWVNDDLTTLRNSSHTIESDQDCVSEERV